MPGATPDPVVYPLSRQTPFDPPGELGGWREEAPIRPMLFADGHLGWLATGYAAVRSVLADPRFSTDPSLLHPMAGHRTRLSPLMNLRGFFIRRDPPEHTRLRRLLTGQFTVRRMRLLEPMIEKITSDRLDGMQEEGPPTDLVRSFALPIPSLVICELLGVPYADHDRFQRASFTMLKIEATAEEERAALESLSGFIRELVARKRAEPGDDLISGLIATGQLDDEEIAGMAILLLIAGHETTANMLGLGTYLLLTNPGALAALRDDPALADTAVEELLRYLTIIHLGPARAATEDVTIDGVTIKAGQAVMVSLNAANRDPERFGDPGSLDLTRPGAGHLAFGHGIHQCLGQQLARNEMRIAYPALLRRFPGLRLAIPPEKIEMRSNMAVYGVHRLPVTW